jgi:hypothetical protein
MTDEQLGWLLGIILPASAIAAAALIYIKCREKRRAAADYTIDTVKVISD